MRFFPFWLIFLLLSISLLQPSWAEPRQQMTSQEQIEVLQFYIADLEQGLKRCKLERADFQAQGTSLARAQAAATSSKPESLPETTSSIQGVPTNVPPAK